MMASWFGFQQKDTSCTHDPGTPVAREKDWINQISPCHRPPPLNSLASLTAMTPPRLTNLIITIPNTSIALRDRFEKRFRSVHIASDGTPIPPDVLSSADVWFAFHTGLTPDVKSLEDIPKLRLLQLVSGEFVRVWRAGSQSLVEIDGLSQLAGMRP